MIVYDKRNGHILGDIPEEQDPKRYYRNYDKELVDNIATLIIDEDVSTLKLHHYIVVNRELVKLSDQEIRELKLYGKVLSEEERQLQKLKPSPEEVRKAEQTIEILTLIQEVM